MAIYGWALGDMGIYGKLLGDINPHKSSASNRSEVNKCACLYMYLRIC